MSSYSIHGELIANFPDDITTLTAVILYDSGSPDTVRTLLAGEVLYITDVFVLVEAQGAVDVQLVADSAAVGRYIINGALDGGVPFVKHYKKPFACPHGTGLKFKSAGLNHNACIIEGFIREG